MKKIHLLSLVIALTIFHSLISRADAPLSDKFNNFITYYYKDPRPEEVPKALAEFVSSEFFKSAQSQQSDSLSLMAYSFGRIAQLEPRLLIDYENIFAKTSHEGRKFILEIFKFCGNEEVKNYLREKSDDEDFRNEKEVILKTLEGQFPYPFNIYEKEVEDPRDLDLLWVEFMVTGDEKAITKVIEVLEWKDITRERLNTFLNSHAPVAEKESLAKVLDEELRIKIDLSTHQIKTNEDLDNLMVNFLQYSRKDKRAFLGIRDKLGLEDSDIWLMAIKGSAVWSLGSNVQQHERVLEICDQEIPKRSDQAKITLLRIAAQGYQMADMLEKTVERLKPLSDLTPYDPQVHSWLGEIYVENKDIVLAQVELAKLRGLDDQRYKDLKERITFLELQNLQQRESKEKEVDIDSQEILRSINQSFQEIRSYKTFMTMKVFTQPVKFKDYFTIEWVMDSVEPDKFLVTQSAWETNGPVYDRWMTISGEGYFQIGGWFKNPEGVEGRDKDNEFLRLKKWITLINHDPIDSMKIFEFDQRQFIVLDLQPLNIGDFFLSGDDVGLKTENEVEIWLDHDSLFIQKATLLVKGVDAEGKKIDLAFEQVFTEYNSDIKIEKPKDLIDLESLQQQE